MAGLLVREARLVPLRGGRVPDGPVDLRVAGGRVAEVAPTLRPTADDVVLGAEGRWLVPGLWDAHVHLGTWAQTLGWLDTAGATSAAEAARLVAGHVAGLADPATAVVGWGHRSVGWPDRPTTAGLDAVAGGHPVVLVSGDGHHGWLSTAAARLLGAPETGAPLAELDWFPVFARLAELPGVAPDDAAYTAAVRGAAARGVVGVVDLEFGSGYLDWPARFQRGVDLLRVRTATYADGLDAVAAAGLRSGDPLPGGGGLLTMGPLKVIGDGSLNTRTAWCHEPYADGGASSLYGAPHHTAAELADLLRCATASGLEVAVHAIGDAAVGSVLDAVASVGARGSVEHAQLMTRADVVRMAALPLRASVQPWHLVDDRDVTARCWPDRADRCFMLGSLHAAGVPLALGSDAPVAPLDPWLAMAAAVHRSGDEREPWNPAESVSAAVALASSVDGRATVGVGSRGDLVLLDADPLAPGPSTEVAARLRSMPVAATVVAGRVTHLA